LVASYDYSFPGGARLAFNVEVALEAWGGPAPTRTLPTPPFPPEAERRGIPDLGVASWQRYGPSTGFPRLMAVLEKHGVPVSVAVNALVAEQSPELIADLPARGHEIIAHGVSQDRRLCLMDEAEDRQEIARCVAAIDKVTGAKPKGWSSPAAQFSRWTLANLLDAGFVYTNDLREADHPYVAYESGGARLVAMPRNDELNDAVLFARYGNPPSVFVEFFRRTFDQLYLEAGESPRIMTVILHSTYLGRPWGAAAVAECVQYVRRHADVWVCKRHEAAEHFLASI
jgi:peptidoglycan/xylan/chitin deacetylase (PgdA/CDA1 family)